MLPADAPFVLLDDARPGGAQTLYRDPHAIVVARHQSDVRPALDRLRDAVRQGCHAAGWIGYETGFALEPKLAALAEVEDAEAPPLLWFGLFRQAERIDPAAFSAMLPDPAGAWAGAPTPLVSRSDYAAALARVKDWIAAGDIYQANLSFRASVAVQGTPLALYARLRAAAGAGWGGVVHDGTRWLLSFSPELFFRTDGSRIVTRPMKGTAPRGRTPVEDDANAAALAADHKERAENLMIVDLLRNDLSRVARPGSVRVPELFAVERYPTVQQMVSEVTAYLAPGRDAIDVIEALFPCGSITGAPKLRAMEIIAAVEPDARGPYTGSIGALAPDGSAAFNVAIRTLVMKEGAGEARIGLGSAVVADSTVDGEWRECLAKGAFVMAGARRFDLIETMRFDPMIGLIELDRHVARLGASAQAFGFAFNRHDVRNELHAATFRLPDPARVRLLLAPSGAVAIQAMPLPPRPDEPVAVRIVDLPVDAGDFRLRHKTTDRGFYDAAREGSDAFEVLFVRPDGLLTEGSFTNLFVRRGGRLVTPPLTLGLLPGVLREAMIDAGEAVEGAVRREDLADGFLIGNALRGLIEARLA